MFTEMFTPYRPRDWRGIIDEFLAAEKVRNQAKGLFDDEKVSNDGSDEDEPLIKDAASNVGSDSGVDVSGNIVY